MARDKIYIVILNYNNLIDTIACIESFDCVTNVNYQLIIVDNNSKNEIQEALKKYISLRKDIIFLETKKNLGYAGGNNVGIKYALKKGAEYIAIVNNDVVVNSNSLKSCIDILKKDSSVAFVGPAILEYGSNIIQYTGGMINLNRATAPHLNSSVEYTPSSDMIECDYVGGACVVFKSSIINKIGLLPEDYFLFWEETEWCLKAKKIGMKCICTLSGYINHKGSASIKKEPGLESYYLEKNRILFIKRNANLLEMFSSIIYVFTCAIIKGIIKDKTMFNYIPYYFDGLFGIDKYAKYRK